MRRGIKLTMAVATLVVVGIGLRSSAQPHMHGGAAQSARPSPAPARAAAPSAKGPSSRRAPASPRPRGTTHSTPASLSVTGDLVGTAYGPVQVQITLRDGRITSARTLARPTGDGHTEQINSYAIPLLDQETITAQSARIDTVSGASFTSDGYRQSLQSALDAAHRAGAR